MNQYAKPMDEYFKQRILSATPEQLAGILLEGSQRYLSMAIKAMGQKDYRTQARSLSRVGEFIVEMHLRLNLEDGGEAAENLGRIYDWWSREIMAASGTQESVRLEFVSRQMGELRSTWEAVHQQKAQAPRSGFEVGDQLA